MIIIRQKEFNSKEQKARRRKYDLEQAMKQKNKTEALSQAEMLGEGKTKDLLDRYTKNTKTREEGAMNTFLGKIRGKKVTRTLARDRKDLEAMEKARKLVNEGRQASRKINDDYWSSNVNEHINTKEAGSKYHNWKSDYERALKNSKNKHYLRKERINNLKAAGALAAITGGAVAAGIGAKKLVDKKKSKKSERK